MLNTTYTETIRIPAENLGPLTKRVTEVNKRATKLGVEPMTLVVGDEVTVTEFINRIEVEVLYREVTVTGTTPKYEGWAFVASLEITEAGSIVRSLPGVECPPEHRERGNVCDHCHSKRRRTATYVVVHDDGRSMNVGRNCLKDFLGSGRLNPENIARHFSMFLTLVDGLGDSFGSEGGSGERSYRLPFLLELTGAAVSAYGWCSAGMVRSGKADGATTADNVRMFLTHRPGRGGEGEREMVLRIREEWDNTEEKRTADAEAALAWITGDENASPTSDYIHSIRVLALRGWVLWKDLGFACSILTTWRLAVERLDEVNRREEARRTAAADSDYVGTVGERRPFDLRVNSIKELPSGWGVTVLHMMEDREGNRFKWWASDKRLDPNESGEYLSVKGTIKAHDEYNGVKETVINRVKLVVGVKGEK